MSMPLAIIVGGATGVVALVGIFIFIIWFFLCRNRNTLRTSETGSSEPSLHGKSGGFELTLREARRFRMEELSSATKKLKFSDTSLIGEGKFGAVYKGLLNDGTLIVIKRRSAPPTQDFNDEVRYLSSFHHRNLVSLLGYCQESGQQIIVYEYVPNGSVSVHLYGLDHLHSLSPQLLHKDRGHYRKSTTGLSLLLKKHYSSQFVEAFQSFYVGRAIGDELVIPFDRSKSHPATLTTNKYGVSTKELLKALAAREYLLMKRNSFVYYFKMCQLSVWKIMLDLLIPSRMSREWMKQLTFGESST